MYSDSNVHSVYECTGKQTLRIGLFPSRVLLAFTTHTFKSDTSEAFTSLSVVNADDNSHWILWRIHRKKSRGDLINQSFSDLGNNV